MSVTIVDSSESEDESRILFFSTVGNSKVVLIIRTRVFFSFFYGIWNLVAFFDFASLFLSLSLSLFQTKSDNHQNLTKKYKMKSRG